jgi:hypothetical protein
VSMALDCLNRSCFEKLSSLSQVAEALVDYHSFVERLSEDFRLQEKRTNYVTTKTLLDCINMYVNLLNKHRSSLKSEIKRMAIGLEKFGALKRDVALMINEISRIRSTVSARLDKLEMERLRLESDKKLKAAQRLVDGSTATITRWDLFSKLSNQNCICLEGDALLAAVFVSYAGPFTYSFRRRFWEKIYEPLVNCQIPHTSDYDPLKLLADESDYSGWKNNGLGADRFSREGATLILSSTRWPLLIDPEKQADKWIHRHFKVVHLKYFDQLLTPYYFLFCFRVSLKFTTSTLPRRFLLLSKLLKMEKRFFSI